MELAPAGFELYRLDAAGVDIGAVAGVDRPTGCAAIWVDGSGENSIVVASGANRAVRAAQMPDSLLGPDTLVLLQKQANVESVGLVTDLEGTQ